MKPKAGMGRPKAPAPPRRTAEELLSELEALDESLRAKLEHARGDAPSRYRDELAPLLAQVRVLVTQGSPRARDAVEDALVRFRELLITSNANIVRAVF